MGMSASQIRYCMLSARKSDVEYQGQQINQQRTSLATQSSEYNTELLMIKVPTPPSTDEYTKTTYSFNVNGNEYKVQGINYMSTEYTVPGVVDETGAEIKYPAGTYILDCETNVIKDVAYRGSKYSYSIKEGEQTSSNVVTLNGRTYELFDVDLTSVDLKDKAIHTSNLAMIRETYGFDDTVEFKAVLSSDGTTYEYFLADDLTQAVSKDTQNNAQTGTTSVITIYPQSYKVGAQQVTEPARVGGISVNWAENGRMSSMIDAKGNIYPMAVSTVADQEAYDEAYNTYVYEKDQYNKKIDDINAQLEVIQAQDKQLELQLRNLDTQQNAINTELDAVKAVVEGNVEKTFNIFG